MDMVCVSSSSDRPAMKAHEYRKIVKPLLERRRRARINQCLTDLKSLLLENNPNIDNNEASKLEKADILELTVRHLRDIRRHHRSFAAASATPMPSPVSSPTNNEEFRAGFRECAHEVASCIATLPGMDSALRSRLIAHLTGRVPNTPLTPSSPSPNNPTPPPSPSSSTASSHNGDYLPLSPAASPLDLSPYPTFVYHQREMKGPMPQHSEQQQFHHSDMMMYHQQQQQQHSSSPVHHHHASSPMEMPVSPRRDIHDFKVSLSPWRPW